jgi:hypothetical protein
MSKHISPLSLVNSIHEAKGLGFAWSVTVDDDTQILSLDRNTGTDVWTKGSKDELVDLLGRAKVLIVRHYTGNKRDGYPEVAIRGFIVQGNVLDGNWQADQLAALDLELSCMTDFETGQRRPPVLGEVFV